MDEGRCIKLGLAAILFLQVVQYVYSAGNADKTVSKGGILYIRFVEYKNPTKEDSKGLCCDGWIGICGRCDHRFLICVDTLDGDDGFDSCPIWKIQTTEFPDTDVNHFGSNMHGFSNPAQIPVNNFKPNVNGKRGFKFKIKVTDDDRGHSNHDDVDTLITSVLIDPYPSLAGLSDDDAQQVVFFGNRGPEDPPPTGMTMRVLTWCQLNFYGPDCDVYCKPNNSTTGHYTCDPGTGQKVCLPGWEDESRNCTVFADDCVGNQCQHDSICEDGPGNYTCQCGQGYTGQFCETIIEHCDPNPCMNNGFCINSLEGYECRCFDNYTGQNCTCLRDKPCQRCMDLSLGCQNNAPCEDGTCQCLKGFFGHKCEFDICMFKDCENDGTCIAGECHCAQGFRGKYCHLEMNECLSNPCKNLGKCVDMVDGYRCECLNNFEGKACETEKTNSVTLKLKDEDPVSENRVREDDGNPLQRLPGDPSHLIIGIVVAVVLLLIIIIVILLSMLFRQKRKKRIERQNQQNQTQQNGNMAHFDNPLFGSPTSAGSGSPRSQPRNEEDPYDNIGQGATGGAHANANGVVLSAAKLKAKEDAACGDIPKPPPYSVHDISIQENEYDVPPSRGISNPAYGEAPPLPEKTKPKNFVN